MGGEQTAVSSLFTLAIRESKLHYIKGRLTRKIGHLGSVLTTSVTTLSLS